MFSELVHTKQTDKWLVCVCVCSIILHAQGRQAKHTSQVNAITMTMHTHPESKHLPNPVVETEWHISVDKKNQLDVTFCIIYFSSNSCSTCFGQPCAHHQELTTA